MSVLDYAIRIIKATMKNHSNESFFPYFFIVAAGISVPEIPAAYEIIDECKDKSKKFDEISYIQFENEIKSCETNPMRCYSKWIEFAYPNRIDRSNLFKRLNATAKISSANLLLAQILDSGKFANTVFTTNFDDSLKRALNLIGTKEFVSAENSMDNLIINNHTKEIQIVHVHGTYRFYDCANLENEITEVAGQSGTVSSAHLLDTFLIDQAPIIVGYSGWENDVIMKRIKERISYPTPLQYIWVCYNQKSYDKLPDWLKESSSFIFVVPVIHDEICEDTSCGNDFINKVDEPVIDAAKFFKRLIYELEIPSPTILTNPYEYFSKEINTLLPRNEDVLHLRHWTQRLKLLEKNNSKFEVAVRALEQHFLAKDYNSAAKILFSFDEMALSTADIEFIASFIIEFIDNESTIQPFDDRLSFHNASLNFAEHNLLQMSKTRLNVRVLKAILFLRFANSDKDKAASLIKEIYTLARTDNRLLEVELRALGILSSISDRVMRMRLLNELIDRCPDDSEDTTFVFLKYVAYLNLCSISSEADAVNYIEKAEQLLPRLVKPELEMALYIQKAQNLNFVNDETIRRVWVNQILEILQTVNKAGKESSYIELASALLPQIEGLQETDSQILKTCCVNLLYNYKEDKTNCKEILEYIKCCGIICITSRSEYEKLEYANRAFSLLENFPHMCDALITSLFYILLPYFQLSPSIVSKREKNEKLILIKSLKGVGSEFYNLLEKLYATGCISDLSQCNADVASLVYFIDKESTAYSAYCEGDRDKAEKLFTEVSQSDFLHVSEMAKTNILYMIRRKEARTTRSFWEVLDEKKILSAFDYMNIILQCLSTDDRQNPHFSRAMKQIECLEPEEISGLVDWWNNTLLVGTEESKLALSIIYSEFHNG